MPSKHKKLYNLLFPFFLLVAIQVTNAQIPLTNATWISPGYSGDNGGGSPSPIFKRAFQLKNNAIKTAKLYITAHGLYEAKINGKRVGDGYFTPGYTAYQKRLQYQIYNVKALLAKSNEIRITLGDGWWQGYIYGTNNNYGKDLALLAALEITYTNGKTETIVSDNSWQSATGPIRSSDMYNGETYDATQKITQWSGVQTKDYKDNLVPTTGQPVRKQEVFQPKSFAGDSILDFGQNIAGWLKIKVKGQKGDTLKMQFTEMLDQKGDIYRVPLRGAKATDTYILSGKGTETFEPHFTYHGFRYAKIIWTRGKQRITPTKQNFSAEAVALYTDLKSTGTFSCSNPQLNQLQSNILWSMKDNFFDIPTDCPQRDERLGWTEDADVFCPTACYLMDVSDFYDKWLKDLAAEQLPDGSVPVTVPSWYARGESWGAAGWSDAATFTPWTIYQRYGDKARLERQYPSMKAWVDYVAGISKNDFWTAKGFGDWYPAGPKTPLPYLDQCYWYRSTSTLLQVAKILGKTADTAEYQALLNRIKNAFNQTYLNNIPETQAAYVIGIRFGLLPKTYIDKLVEMIHRNHVHLGTGFMGTPNLLAVLSENGHTDLAYKLLMQRDVPSWLYMVEKGATTMWEKWDAVKPDGSLLEDVSFNHYAFGSVGNWLYENIAGIQAASPGYKKILIAPRIGGGLTWAKGSYQSKYGKIVSEWKIQNNKVLLHIEIPKSTTATVCIPNGDSVHVKAGSYNFTGYVPSANYVPYPPKQKQIPVLDFTVNIRSSIKPEPSIYSEPEKIFAVSDVEGEFQSFKKLLVNNKIIDKNYKWTFGKGHLVVAGDLFDRGEQVTELLWLLYKLEDEAKAQGGYVHTILGNHDIMNLSGDFRYVRPKYLEEAEQLHINYQDMFGKNTELGRWLRSKNTIEKIGDKLFLHGGVSPEVLDTHKTIEQINEQCRLYYESPKNQVPDSLKVFFGKNALFWYRGYFLSPRANLSLIDSTLNYFGCKQLIVGHTILKRNMALYYHGKVLDLDQDWHSGHVGGVLYQDRKWQSMRPDGARSNLVYKPANDLIQDQDVL